MTSAKLIEQAVSLNFRCYSDRPGVVVDSRNGHEIPADALDTKILIYEDRAEGWFFRYGKMLKEDHNAGFIVLQISLAQIEGIEQYRRGESSDGKGKNFSKPV